MLEPLFYASVGFAIFALWWVTFKNKFIVDPNKKERLVIKNILTGDMEVLESGTHFRPIWWIELERVDINREAVQVDGDEFKTRDGAIMKAHFQFDLIAGRAFNDRTGQLLNPNPDEENTLSEKALKQAVTKINFKERVARVKGIMRSAMARELGLYYLVQITNPSKDPNGVKLAALIIAGVEICPAVTVHTIAELNAELAKRFEARCNARLTFVGLTVTAVEISVLKASDKTQESVEKPLQAVYEADAAEETLKRAKAYNADIELSYREAMVAEDPAAFAETTKAEAYRGGFKGLSEAIRELANNLHHFGRG